jgi:uncharacterized oxidoreductase
MIGNRIRVQPGPANYYCYPGAFEELDKLYPREVLEKAFLVHGKRALAGAKPYLPASVAALAGERRFLFSGHCSHELVESLAPRADDSRLIIGLGGGSALDTAKALAVHLGLPFAALPSIAATCSAATPLSVWYTAEGKALGFEIFNKAAETVLVEPRIIHAAPPEYLQAGLADTLAKWYEASILTAGLGPENGPPLCVRLGLQAAALLKQTLLEKGRAALAAFDKAEPDGAFIELVDAVILGGGLVGGLGEKYTRVAAAHAVHNGLSVLAETHRVLHGLKVAYGLLVQAALADGGELDALVREFRGLGLPLCLGDIGVNADDRDALKRFARASLVPHESIHYLPFPVDEARFLLAVQAVEKAAKNCV